MLFLTIAYVIYLNTVLNILRVPLQDPTTFQEDPYCLECLVFKVYEIY